MFCVLGSATPSNDTNIISSTGVDTLLQPLSSTSNGVSSNVASSSIIVRERGREREEREREGEREKEREREREGEREKERERERERERVHLFVFF